MSQEISTKRSSDSSLSCMQHESLNFTIRNIFLLIFSIFVFLDVFQFDDN